MKSIITVSKSLHLSGTIRISGSKNISFPIISACLAIPGKHKILGVPKISDVNCMLKIASNLGCKITKSRSNQEEELTYSDQDILIDSSNLNINDNGCLLIEDSDKLRGAIALLSSCVTRSKKIKFKLPGGCQIAIGGRPIDLHIQVLNAFKIEAYEKDNYLHVNRKEDKILGTNIVFPKISVGATMNAIILGCVAHGKTCIKNAATERDVIELCNFLKLCGAKIDGYGTREVVVYGTNYLYPRSFLMPPDRIETITYMSVALATKSKISLKNTSPILLSQDTIDLFKEMGLKYSYTEPGNILLDGTSGIKSVSKIEIKEDPGIPTDAQPLLFPLLLNANGESKIEEKVFENRFLHVKEFKKLGAKIDLENSNNTAILKGKKDCFIGCDVQGTDLRATAALCIAGMMGKGETNVHKVHHLQRGYEDFVKKLQSINANIKIKNIVL